MLFVSGLGPTDWLTTSNPELLVVLGEGGKPVTVIRALDDDDDVIGRDQRSAVSPTGARVSAEVKKVSLASSFDYCNSLYYNLPKSQLNRLQHIRNSLARAVVRACLLYTSPSPRDRTRSRMPSSA